MTPETPSSIIVPTEESRAASRIASFSTVEPGPSVAGYEPRRDSGQQALPTMAQVVVGLGALVLLALVCWAVLKAWVAGGQGDRIPATTGNFSTPAEATHSVAPATMTSQEIAELTGRDHAHVLRDIRRMLEDLDLNSTEFSAQYRDSAGRTLPAYAIPKDLTLTLVSGYSASLRYRFAARWAVEDLDLVHTAFSARRKGTSEG